MRAAQLIRSRTRKGCAVSIDLYQAPVIIYAQSGDVDDNTVIPPLSLAIHVTTGHEPERQIGAITILRQVLLRRRIRMPRTKQKWTDWEEIQRQEVEVVSECVIRGSQRFECTLPLPKRLPESRQTHYDQLIHLVTATVHDLSPSYRSHRTHFSRPPGRSRASSTASVASLGRKSNAEVSELRTVPEEEDHRIRAEELEEVKIKALDAIAVCKKLFEVAYCPTPPGEVPTLDGVQSVRLEDSGLVKAKLESDLFVMGSTVDLKLDLLNLTLDTTIHALSVQLVQETSTPVKSELPDDITVNPDAPPAPTPNTVPPSRTSFFRRRSLRDEAAARPPPLSRLTSIFSRVKEKPAAPQTSIIDEYILHREGIDHYITARELGVRAGHYLWRGAAGREYDQRCAAAMDDEEEEYLDEYKLDHLEPNRHADTMLRTTSSLRIQRVLRLPSELHGAHATSSTLAPVLARVSHRIAVTVLYSILGFDSAGKPLQDDEAARSRDGGVRKATMVFEIGLAQCSVVPSVIQPPVYSTPSDHAAASVFHQPATSPRRSLRRLSMETVRSMSVGRPQVTAPVASQPIPEERPLGSAPPNPLQHTRAFKASNGLVVSGNTVFYADAEVQENWRRHHRDRTTCACSAWESLT